eukprot:COSAG04_NODE_11604_length_699_cov_1.090000_1_plen_60_part_10
MQEAFRLAVDWTERSWVPLALESGRVSSVATPSFHMLVAHTDEELRKSPRGVGGAETDVQ